MKRSKQIEEEIDHAIRSLPDGVEATYSNLRDKMIELGYIKMISEIPAQCTLTYIEDYEDSERIAAKVAKSIKSKIRTGFA